MHTLKQKLKTQRGSMVLEIALVAAVLAVLGFVGWRYYAAQQTAKSVTTPVASNKSTDLPKADGKVETAVTAVSDDADIDGAASAATENDAAEVTATSDDAAQIQGSIDKNAF